MTKLSLNKVENFIKGLDQTPALKQEFDRQHKKRLFFFLKNSENT